MKTTLRVRIGQTDVHYAGNLASAGKVMELFSDVATELLVRHDGDEGLMRAYETVEFLAPVLAGDFLEVTGEIVATGRTSRKIVFEARKVITLTGDPFESSAAVLDEPVVVARAVGTAVVPADRQRGRG